MNQQMRGLGVVELLLALLIGTLVVAAAISVFVSNRQTVAATQGLARIQQNMQAALELLARDLKMAGGNPCSRNIPLANVLNAQASRWWTRLASAETADVPWGNSVRGLSTAEFPAGTGAGERVAGSDAIELLSADAHAVTVVSHDGTRLILNTAAHGFVSGQLLLVCDPRQASLFQATVSGSTLRHPAGAMNCSAHLGLPGGCEAAPFVYAPPALVARWAPVRWYLGHNGRGGTSLYQMVMDRNGQSRIRRQEVVTHIRSLAFRYRLAGASADVPISGVAGQWHRVVAVRIEISASGTEDTTDAALMRTAAHTVSLRNRLP